MARTTPRGAAWSTAPRCSTSRPATGNPRSRAESSRKRAPRCSGGFSARGGSRRRLWTAEQFDGVAFRIQYDGDPQAICAARRHLRHGARVDRPLVGPLDVLDVEADLAIGVAQGELALVLELLQRQIEPAGRGQDHLEIAGIVHAPLLRHAERLLVE